MDEFIIKSEELPHEYGKYPGSRSVEELLNSGLIILDKWAGPTSHDVTATIKKIFGLKKAGHAGTLDPQVTGVLPIVLENACKVIPALQRLDKEYVGVMKLHKDVDEKTLLSVMQQFIGKIIQRPPVRSAVARNERQRQIYSFEILDKDKRNIAFKVKCEAGTYIRKLIDDLGKQIGGAHMTELRRTRVGRFNEAQLVRMHDIADAYDAWKKNGDEQIRKYVLPLEAAIEHIGKIIIKDSAVYSVASGSPLYTTGISKVQKNIQKNDLIAILTIKGELVALAKAMLEGRDMKGRKMAAKTDRVIIKKDIYPKM